MTGPYLKDILYRESGRQEPEILSEYASYHLAKATSPERPMVHQCTKEGEKNPRKVKRETPAAQGWGAAEVRLACHL